MRSLSLVWQSIWGGHTGYSLHSEAMAEALVDRGVYLMHRQVDSPFAGRPLRPALREAARRPLQSDVPQISYSQCDHFDETHVGMRIGFSMLEVDGIPKDWVDACNRMDEVFVPSHFNKETFAASGVQSPITVVPLGLDPANFQPQGPSFKLNDRYTFLSTFEWGERKAAEILLRAYVEEFGPRERVLLLLKVDNRDPATDVATEISRMDLPTDRAPIAFLYNQQLPWNQLATLYRSADCFVLPTRGEGWGMPILEAMACGLPVIATNWSAQQEFLHEDYTYPLEVESLVPATAKCPYYEGFRWAEASRSHLSHLMRTIFENRSQAEQKGARAAQEVRNQWTWAHTAERIIARMHEIG